MKQPIHSTHTNRVACAHRRGFIAMALGLPWAGIARAGPPMGAHPDPRWWRLADEMRQRALSWGDQDYGAVLVLEGEAIGLGPSRVVIDRDPDAHAERVALRDAQRRTGRTLLPGAVLYSTSRPCALCESAAARAQVARMVHGPALTDAGVPQLR